MKMFTEGELLDLLTKAALAGLTNAPIAIVPRPDLQKEAINIAQALLDELNELQAD